jgi:dCTP deaminase
MAFWSGETIRARNQSTPSIIDPFDEKWIDCNAYTLHMGNEIFVTPHRKMRNRYEKLKYLLREGDSFHIPPGQFAFLLTKEYLNMPSNTMAFISLRSRIKYKGLINVSGFHVDPGFHGHLVYAVYNAGPTNIVIDQGESLFLIWFAGLDNPETTFNREDRDEQIHIGSDIIQHVPGHILSLQSITGKIENIERNMYRIIYGFIIGGAILTLGHRLIMT